ncbi:UNVERIFIED_CONTAM: Retrovirus-related Pol polyprotein from transposon RE1, partial [Sesamum latifolium]
MVFFPCLYRLLQNSSIQQIFNYTNGLLSLLHFLFFTQITPKHGCFAAALSSLQEPRNYQQAKDKREWMEAMQAEIIALERNNTWITTQLPDNKKAIGCRWMYKLKLKPDGTVEFKARLVAKGYSQMEGVDYTDCFAPVAKTVTVRVFLAIAASKGWPIHHFDVNNAFLHSTLEEDIYMEPLEGYQVPEGHVCKLVKSLYGLKQASRKWNEDFTERIKSFGFTQSKHDYCLFTKATDTGLISLLLYVDDILVTGPTETHISDIKGYLIRLFTIKDL